jgi:hypothetical protein
MDCDEPHFMLNEKTQPIQWTEWPTGALVATSSLWPKIRNLQHEKSLPNDFIILHPIQV